jgi:hypothetical protein
MIFEKLPVLRSHLSFLSTAAIVLCSCCAELGSAEPTVTDLYRLERVGTTTVVITKAIDDTRAVVPLSSDAGGPAAGAKSGKRFRIVGRTTIADFVHYALGFRS